MTVQCMVAELLQYFITYILYSIIHISVQQSSFYIHFLIFLFNNRHFIFNVSQFCSVNSFHVNVHFNSNLYSTNEGNVGENTRRSGVLFSLILECSAAS